MFSCACCNGGEYDDEIGKTIEMSYVQLLYQAEAPKLPDIKIPDLPTFEGTDFDKKRIEKIDSVEMLRKIGMPIVVLCIRYCTATDLYAHCQSLTVTVNTSRDLLLIRYLNVLSMHVDI